MVGLQFVEVGGLFRWIQQKQLSPPSASPVVPADIEQCIVVSSLLKLAINTHGSFKYLFIVL